MADNLTAFANFRLSDDAVAFLRNRKRQWEDETYIGADKGSQLAARMCAAELDWLLPPFTGEEVILCAKGSRLYERRWSHVDGMWTLISETEITNAGSDIPARSIDELQAGMKG